jgi:predicted tellurium resistance membrane protein TerC
MEIVLGIDNIVFVTILCGRLPRELETKARRIGIGLALFARLALLFAISWVMGLTKPIGFLQSMGIEFSGRSAILLGGGIFLIGKATHEIYTNVELPEGHEEDEARAQGEDTQAESPKKLFWMIMAQIIALDIVFSLDSVITAVGMADDIEIMAVAMIIAVGIMLVFAGPIGDFVQDNPSVKILALAFLVLIGSMLVMESMGQHVSKGYIYAAMGFSLSVELVNLRRLKRMKAARAAASVT